MKKMFAIALCCAVPMTAMAQDDFATKSDAQAMVSKAVKAITADREGAFTEISARKWIQKDLYPMVYDMSGKCVAHGANPKQVGKDLIELADADGKEFVKERIELAKSKGKFWQDYKFTDPVSKKVLPKSAYCEKVSDVIVCAGIYNR